MWKWFSRLVVVLALLLAGVRIADLVSRRGPQLPPVPAGNVYPRLLATAGQMEMPVGDVSMLAESEVRRLSAANRERLLLVHADVRGESGVPLSTARGWGETHAQEQRSFKRLTAALGVQARAESLEGRTNAVAAAWLDLLLLGPTMSRSGILSDSLNGLALESVGLMGLRPLVPSLDAAVCRAAAQELEALEARRDTPARVLETEANWSRGAFGLVGMLGDRFRGSGKARREADFAQRHHPVVRRTRQLALQLAVRALELERGTPVKSADEVVPSVLKSVPLDPETGKPLELQSANRVG